VNSVSAETVDSFTKRWAVANVDAIPEAPEIDGLDPGYAQPPTGLPATAAAPAAEAAAASEAPAAAEPMEAAPNAEAPAAEAG
jgi:hypothetical protein